MTITSILSAVAAPEEPTVDELIAEMTDEERGTIRQIESYIRNPPRGSKRFTITPRVANWLVVTKNDGNRPKKPGKIRQYADDMRLGAGSPTSPHGFPMTGDTMKFSDKGLLRDGQNRCLACIMADTPFATQIMFGIEDWVFAFLDRGKNRSSGDILAIAGYDNGQTAAAAIRWAELLANDPKSRATPQQDETLQLMRDTYDRGGLGERILEAKAICAGPKGPTRPSTGFVAGILWHCYLSDPKKAAQFAVQWRDKGATKRRKGGITRTPISVMNRKLQAVYDANGRIHDTVRAAWAVIAWNCFKAGEAPTVKSFEWTVEDDFPDFE